MAMKRAIDTIAKVHQRRAVLIRPFLPESDCHHTISPSYAPAPPMSIPTYVSLDTVMPVDTAPLERPNPRAARRFEERPVQRHCTDVLSIAPGAVDRDLKVC